MGRGQGRTLPLRVWLILVVGAIIGFCCLVEVGLTGGIFHAGAQAGAAQLASVRRIIGTDATRWGDPAWQRRAAPALAARGLDIDLFAGRPGHLVFATAGARRLLDTGLLAATGRAAGPAPDAIPYHPYVSPSPLMPVFERLVITDPAPAADRRPPVAVVFLWFIQAPSSEPSVALWSGVGVATLALALALVVWLLRRPVLRPLAALSQAVEGVAGGDLEVRLPLSPVREIADVTAALEGMSAALRDALARQNALEEERKLFVGAIAHDLRTPLFTLRAYLQGLQTGIAATPEKARVYVEECVATADALERLVADLFAYTRLEYLEQEPARAPLELGALLRQAVEGAQPLASAKGIALALDGPAKPYAMRGDSHLLARMMENLLNNAVRHTPAGGQIWVRWGRVRGALHFAVEDTGPGIAAHDLPHLFTPLYRGETSRNRQTGGAGLGLTIARRILRAHGGDLIAANRTVGGAVFTGTLPAARLAPPVADLVAATRS